MALQLTPTSAATTLLIIAASVFTMRWLRVCKEPKELDLTSSLTEPAIQLNKKLVSALSDNVILPNNSSAFKQSMNAYWAQQECEVIPACVVRPRDVKRLSAAIAILKEEYDARIKNAGEEKGLFAIRAGGHSPVPGAASIKGGVVIDLSLLCEVTPSEDGKSVVIGAGAKWHQVYSVLDKKGLTVAGGRNSAVGVGGLTLGGGISFFSPQCGMVCNNVLSYEVVIASGTVVTASASENSDLWRALKGGANNFGIVAHITVPSFPTTNIWSGMLYMTAGQAPKVLSAFTEYVARTDSSHDRHAAGPLACFTYLQKLGIQAVTVNLVHVNPPKNENKWPACWDSSSFNSIWRLWSTCKIRTITSASDEVTVLNPPGRRQVFGTTTIKNDLATLTAVHKAYHDAISVIGKIKNMSWTLVLQPLLPQWTSKGDPNPLGLDDETEDPLVIVAFTVNWTESKDDAFVKDTVRCTLEQIESFVAEHKTGHRYQFLNYCGEWQKPFESYGEGNFRFLRDVSRKYDPEGLFQKGCVGGFKLGAEY